MGDLIDLKKVSDEEGESINFMVCPACKSSAFVILLDELPDDVWKILGAVCISCRNKILLGDEGRKCDA